MEKNWADSFREGSTSITANFITFWCSGFLVFNAAHKSVNFDKYWLISSVKKIFRRRFLSFFKTSELEATVIRSSVSFFFRKLTFLKIYCYFVMFKKLIGIVKFDQTKLALPESCSVLGNSSKTIHCAPKKVWKSKKFLTGEPNKLQKR